MYPEKSFDPYPKGILNGFRKFRIEKSLEFEVIDKIYDDMILKNGDLFITIVEDDLVNLINQIRDNEFQIGKDIGVLSYNNSPLKVLLGISVVSKGFKFILMFYEKKFCDKLTPLFKKIPSLKNQ